MDQPNADHRTCTSARPARWPLVIDQLFIWPIVSRIDIQESAVGTHFDHRRQA
jgi:hypothetical protein